MEQSRSGPRTSDEAVPQVEICDRCPYVREMGARAVSEQMQKPLLSRRRSLLQKQVAKELKRIGAESLVKRRRFSKIRGVTGFSKRAKARGDKKSSRAASRHTLIGVADPEYIERNYIAVSMPPPDRSMLVDRSKI